MKKLYNPLPTGGAPLFTETLNEVLQTELYAALEGFFSTLDWTQFAPPSDISSDGTGLIVRGGEVTDNGATFDVAAGVAFFPVARVLARFTETTGIDSGDDLYLTLGSAVNTTKTFFDGSAKNYYAEITCNKYEGVVEPVEEFVRIRLSATKSGVPNYYMGHPTIGNFLKMLALGGADSGLIALTPANSWTAVGSVAYVRKVGSLVHLSVYAGSAASATASTFCSIPTGYRPAYNVIGSARGTTSGTIYPTRVIASTGTLDFIGANGQTEAEVEVSLTYPVA